MSWPNVRKCVVFLSVIVSIGCGEAEIEAPVSMEVDRRVDLIDQLIVSLGQSDHQGPNIDGHIRRLSQISGKVVSGHVDSALSLLHLESLIVKRYRSVDLLDQPEGRALLSALAYIEAVILDPASYTPTVEAEFASALASIAERISGSADADAAPSPMISLEGSGEFSQGRTTFTRLGANDDSCGPASDFQASARSAVMAGLGRIPEVGGLVQGLAGLLWEDESKLSVNTWGQIQACSEALIGKALTEEHQNEVNLYLENLYYLLDDYKDYIDSKNYQLLVPHLVDLFNHIQLTLNTAFTAKGYEVVLLPQYAQLKNIELAIYRDVLIYGADWGINDLSVQEKNMTRIISEATDYVDTWVAKGRDGIRSSLPTNQNSWDLNISRFKSMNAYDRAMIQTVTDYQFAWKYMDPREYPNGTNKLPGRELYSQPYGCDTYEPSLWIESEPTAPITRIKAYTDVSSGRISGMAVSHGGEPSVVQAISNTWDMTKEFDYKIEDVGPVVQVNVTSGLWELTYSESDSYRKGGSFQPKIGVNALELIFSKGVATGVVGDADANVGGQSYLTCSNGAFGEVYCTEIEYDELIDTYEEMYEGQILSSVKIQGASKWPSARCLILGFKYAEESL